MEFMHETRSFTGASWQKTPLECSTHAAPAQEAVVLPIEDPKGRVIEIVAKAVSPFSFSIPLLHSCCSVQHFLDDEDRFFRPK